MGLSASDPETPPRGSRREPGPAETGTPPESPRTTDERRPRVGTASAPEGITNPPIDELLEATDSKYSLVIYASKRARQINAYYSQLGEGPARVRRPPGRDHVQEKPLSIALREINAGLLTAGRWTRGRGRRRLTPVALSQAT